METQRFLAWPAMSEYFEYFEYFEGIRRGCDTALLGRRNYAGFHAMRPWITEDPATDPRTRDLGRWLCSVEQGVVSTTLPEADATWPNSQVFTDPSTARFRPCPALTTWSSCRSAAARPRCRWPRTGAPAGPTGSCRLPRPRSGLRPTEAMATQADRITAGDLTDRVTPHDPGTEVGRLGTALNGMLARIEAGLQEREASQQQMRRFFADASHELRTPLASLRANAELYQQGALAGPRRSTR